MTDRIFQAVVTAVICIIAWLALAITLARGVVFPLWGMASDFALLGSVFAGLGSIALLAVVARLMVRLVENILGLNNKEAPNDE